MVSPILLAVVALCAAIKLWRYAWYRPPNFPPGTSGKSYVYFYVAHKFGRLAVSLSPSAASGLIDADRVREVSVPVVLASSMAYQSDAIQECATISYRRMARLTTVVSVFVCSLVRFWYARVLITVFGYGFECLSSHIT